MWQFDRFWHDTLTDADICQLSTHLPLTLILMVISTGLFYVNGGSTFEYSRRKYLRIFQPIFAGRSCDDFLSNLKNSHESMGLYLSEYWSNEEKNFFPTCTSLSCTPQYDFYPLKTFPFFTDLNTSLVIRKIPWFSHMIKISTFTDIFLNFFRWWNVPQGTLNNSI